MALSNTWIGYIDRSYEQVKSAILSRVPYDVPEITDHTEGNIFVRMISVWAGITEQFNYYIDAVAREVFLPVAQEYATGVYHAITADYRIKGVIAASVDITLNFNQAATTAFTIPVGTLFQTKDGILFRSIQSVSVPMGVSNVTVACENSLEFPNQVIGTSDGTPNQIFILDDGVVDTNITITIGVDTWLFVSTFVFSGSDAKVFSTNVNTEGEVYLIFGDGVNGAIPTTGATITASYLQSLGSAGNVAQGTIVQIISLTLPVGMSATCYNISGASGGYDIESLSQLKKNIPLSLRTLDRAVTGQDYVDIALLCNGVAQASTQFNCGKTVYIYVIGAGGAIASSSLIRRINNWFEDKRMVTTLVRAKSAGVLEIVINADIFAKPNYMNSVVEDTVTNNLVARYSVENQIVRGSVYIGDIYQTMENSEGVDRTELTLLTFRPAAIPRVSNSAQVLNWNSQMGSGSVSTIAWAIKTTASTTTFQLYKGAQYIGELNYGTVHTYPELTLEVLYDSAYTNGDIWDFKTYKVGGSLTVDELSIPLVYAENVTLNVMGGV